MRQKAVTDDLVPDQLANVTRVLGAAFYRDALARAEGCAELIAQLGQPLEADLPSGGIQSLGEGTPVERAVTQKYLAAMLRMMRAANPIGDADRFAHVAVVLRGPKGQGKLILFASGAGDSWTFHSLDVAVEGREDRISLMPASW